MTTGPVAAIGATTEGPPVPRERLGAIDVGSNSIRLLVAEYDRASGLSIIDEVRDQPRLAQGLARTGRLDDAAIEHAVQVLSRMRDVCERRGVSRISAVATSAVREAANGAEFVRRVQEEIGIPLRIIDGDAEAALSYRSVAYHFKLDASRTLVADIGGGSLELIGAVNGLVELTASLPLGAVRLTELHLDDADTIRRVRKLRAQVRKQLRKGLSSRDWGSSRLIGSGGTFTTLARMAIARRGAPIPENVHGVEVTTAEVEHLLEWLSTKSPEQRRAVAGLSPQRADIILAGLAVTAELLALVDARSLTVSAFGLRDGLLLEMAGADADRRRDPLRLVREFAERCQSDRRHIEQVRHLSLLLFDQLAPVLGGDPEERLLLESAALIHDVGQLVSYRRHHHHSFQLIMHAERLHFSARDRLLVALISRYHRKSGPSRKDDDYGQLPAEERAIVRRLSGVLRVADGLDRGHTAIIESLATTLTDERLVVSVVPRYAGADLALECWGASRKADVLAKVLGRDVEIRTAAAPGVPPIAGVPTGPQAATP
ncbi:MAG TPA: Ppx/GppA phosphatase family protein [Gemmatimonadales bacterium]|nr:Ppx/GppA phosphatase family protein [Gemmatimonadales bacterium]